MTSRVFKSALCQVISFQSQLNSNTKKVKQALSKAETLNNARMQIEV